MQELLRSATYTGSANHKRRPADDGFHPPVNPHPHKSLCDDLRPLLLKKAQRLFIAGIRRGMVSAYRMDGFPKYV